MRKRRLKINLPGPRWLQFIYLVILTDLFIYGIVAASCWFTSRCSPVDWSNRMFWGGMAVFAIGLPAVGASFMGLAGSTAVGTNPVAMGLEASAMFDVVKYEQAAQKERMKFFWWPFAIGAGAMLISILITETAPSLAGLPPDFSKPDRAMPSKVVTQLDEEINRSANFIPVAGATLAVWDGENPVFIQGYGDASTALDSRYAIGEITQQFTAAAILKLAESGELSLDGVVTAYIPELPDSYYGIKLKHLLTHTSGLPADTDVMPEIEAVLGPDPWHSDTSYTAEDFLALTLQAFPEPLAEAGTTYIPSEQGYRLLGMVIEAVTGQSYNDYIRTQILEPAGLTATAPCEIDSTNLATGHVIDNSKPVATDMPNTSFAYAAGNLCSNVTDLVQWQYTLNLEELLSAESVASIYRPTTFRNGVDVKPEPDTWVGLGCTLEEDSLLGYYATYAGSIPGYDSMVRTYYAKNVVIVVLSDTSISETRKESGNGLDRMVEQVLWAMDDSYLLD